MPLNNQTPDPRFQRVLVAARALAQMDVDVHGVNVDWPAVAMGLQRLRESLADLEGGGASRVTATKKQLATPPPHAT